MTTIRRILATVTGVVMACGLASASTLTVSCTTTSGPTELGVGGSTSGQVNCPGESSIPAGEITGITISITGSVISPSDITLDNTDSKSHVFSGTTESGLTIDGSTPLPGVTLTTDAFGNLLTVLAGTGNQTLAGGQQTTYSVTGTSTAGPLSVASGSFGFYESAFDFIGDTITTLNANTAGGNGSAGQVTDDSLTASVTYTYSIPTGTPEPASFALIGFALVGFGVARQRFKKNLN